MAEKNDKHACVRDLAWALSSPPLMQPDDSGCHWFDDHWCRQLGEDSENWLHQLDADPKALQALLAVRHGQRLGRYFESLWAFYFEHSPRFRLLCQNVQIIDGARTLGELDFIVQDLQTGKTLHIEVSVKFYLGVDDTREQHNWYGPNSQDRLDIKMHTLLARQSRLTQQPQVAAQLHQQGICVDACAVILKGRLFYPMPGSPPPKHCHGSHLRGRWQRFSGFDCEPGRCYLPMPRSGWLAPQQINPAACLHHKSVLQALLDDGVLSLPLLLLVFDGERERERVFVVPDDWPQRA